MLVGYDTRATDWFSWNDWLKACGHDGPPVRPQAQYSNYSDAILATINGQGIALGWQALVQGHIDGGDLVRVGKAEVTVRSGRYAVAAFRTLETAPVGDFMRWLETETADLRLAEAARADDQAAP